ncbi:glycerophosphodiester phosphodiesterase family protein [Solicola sp. PLA-1-18]|uniref:glycerophosphodiester phosphodiesterase family protein n=1 Tax=Solicola sp. PLA-1-18 TaxID=3380532 RepID=UPI003B77AD5F
MEPWIVAHRGASGERVEHTRAAFELAVEQGADLLEPDVVLTSDGHLVVRHANDIAHCTDVADRPEFADRHTTRWVDGVEVTGWFTEDFTLAEIRTLRAREARPNVRPDNTRQDDQHGILTLDELCALLGEVNRARETPVGLCVELKHPTYYGVLGHDLADLVLGVLDRHDLATAGRVPVQLESMETRALRDLRSACDLTIVQLLWDLGAPYDLTAAGDPRTYADLSSAEGLAEVATYADAVGANKLQVLPRDAQGRSTEPSSLVDDAHAHDLEVVVWTLRDENVYLPAELRHGDEPTDHGDAAAEYEAFFDTGVDGVFTDFPRTAYAAREEWKARQRSSSGIRSQASR